MSARKRARFESSPSVTEDSSQSNALNYDGPSQSHRMESFRRTAQRRAEHFARAEKDDISAAPSTTPTGRLRKVKIGRNNGNQENGDDEGEAELNDNVKEAWPGPWSTARNILAQRDEAKRSREEAAARLRNASNYMDVGDDDPVELDAYDKAILSLSSWSPGRNNSIMKFIPKLSTLCVDVLAKYVNHYENLNFIPSEHLDRLADKLGKDRQLDLNTCVRLAVTGSTSLYLPDCGAIDEDILIQAVETVNGIHRVDMADEVIVTEDANIQSIQRLVLKSCGRCFSDKVAGAIYNHIHHLEELVLTGCYRLSNEGFVKLLESSSSKLQILDISCNSRLNATGMRAISALTQLKSLTLDHINQLTDQDLLLLTNSVDNSSAALSHIEEISLIGCNEISDLSLVPFLEQYGGRLTGFSVSSYKVADDTVIALRTYCRCLQRLRLVNLAEVTAAALIGLFVVQQQSSSGVSSSSLRTNISDNESLGPLSLVDLHGGVSVFDEAVIQLLLNYGRSLQSLNIHGCSQLTNRAAAAIWLHGYQALKYLDMSFVRKFSEAAVGKIIENCVLLEALRIWGCTQITAQLLTGHSNVNLHIVGNFSQ